MYPLREECRLRVFEHDLHEANIWSQEGWEWGVERFRNEEFHSLYLSLNIVRVRKSRRLRWTNHVGGIHAGLIRATYVETPKRKH